MRMTSLAAAAAALLVAAPMAFANGVTGGTITAVDAAAHTMALDGASYSVAYSVDLGALKKGEQVAAYVNSHASPRQIERIVTTG